MIKIIKLEKTSFSVEVVQTAEGDEIWIDEFDFVFPHAVPISMYYQKEILSFYNEYMFPVYLQLKLHEKKEYKREWFNTYRNKFWQTPTYKYTLPATLDNELKTKYEKEYELEVFTKVGCYDIIDGPEEVLNFIPRTEENYRPVNFSWVETMCLLGQENGNIVFKEVEAALDLTDL